MLSKYVRSKNPCWKFMQVRILETCIDVNKKPKRFQNEIKMDQNDWILIIAEYKTEWMTGKSRTHFSKSFKLIPIALKFTESDQSLTNSRWHQLLDLRTYLFHRNCHLKQINLRTFSWLTMAVSRSMGTPRLRGTIALFTFLSLWILNPTVLNRIIAKNQRIALKHTSASSSSIYLNVV